ncbi:MAG TPA: hypothetical protein VIC24_14795 [Gemmatimonadaceae bacterium]|jgi:hypothetical protein
MPATAVLIALGACGGGSGGGAQASGNCGAPDGPEITSALDQYLAGLDPQPQRFLYYAVGDSALPYPAVTELQAKGPTYIWPSEPAQQKKQLESLKSKGDAITLLVLWTGMDTTKTSSSSVGFAGRFMDAEDSDKPVPGKNIGLQCRGNQWQVTPAPNAKPSPSA